MTLSLVRPWQVVALISIVLATLSMGLGLWLHAGTRSTDPSTAERQVPFRVRLPGTASSPLRDQVETYFAADADERTALLDQAIDRMQQQRQAMARRSQRPARPGPANDGGPANRTARAPSAGISRNSGLPPSRTQRQQWLESRDPDQQARHMAYVSALKKRMHERGITGPIVFLRQPPNASGMADAPEIQP